MGTAWKRDWGFVIELYEVVFSVLDSGYCRDGYFLFFDFLLEKGKEGSRSEVMEFSGRCVKKGLEDGTKTDSLTLTRLNSCAYWKDLLAFWSVSMLLK